MSLFLSFCLSYFIFCFLSFFLSFCINYAFLSFSLSLYFFVIFFLPICLIFFPSVFLSSLFFHFEFFSSIFHSLPLSLSPSIFLYLPYLSLFLSSCLSLILSFFLPFFFFHFNSLCHLETYKSIPVVRAFLNIWLMEISPLQALACKSPMTCGQGSVRLPSKTGQDRTRTSETETRNHSVIIYCAIILHQRKLPR